MPPLETGSSLGLRWESLVCWLRRLCVLVAEQGKSKLERPVEEAAEQLVEIGLVARRFTTWGERTAKL
jgi:hypothetical protein